MLSYSFLQWVMFFYIYCFVGWCIESAIVSFESKKFINRGFLRLPLLPIYGFGALIMLFASLPVKENPFWVYVFAALASTLLELTTGLIMESLFKVKYWDYSKLSYNYKGIICIQSSLFWGFLALLLTYNLHEWVENIVFRFTHQALLITVIIISVLFISDTIFSVKSAFDIRYVMENLSAAREELNKLIAQKVESSEKATAFKERINRLNSERQKLIARLNLMNRLQIRSHPKATSRRFAEAYKEIKEAINKRIN